MTYLNRIVGGHQLLLFHEDHQWSAGPIQVQPVFHQCAPQLLEL